MFIYKNSELKQEFFVFLFVSSSRFSRILLKNDFIRKALHMK